MPFTYLSHQAAVLPLKLWRPRWVAGTALVAGSIAPDIEYFLRGRPLGTYGHTVTGQLLWTVPVALVLTWVLARVLAPGLAPHLPDCGEWRLRDWRHAGAGARTLRYWLAAAPSAWVGGWTHLAWDWFTHDYGEGARLFPGLLRPAATILGEPLPWYAVVWAASTALGALATIWMLRRIGRERLLARWAGAGDDPAADPAESARVRREVAWAVAASIAASLLLAGSVAPPGTGRWWMAAVMRILILPILGAVIVGGLALRRARRAAPLRHPDLTRSSSC